MGNTQLSFHQRFSFINPSQQHVAEVERPDPVIDLFQANAVLPQGGGEIEQPGLEPHRTRIRHALDQEMIRVLERG